MLVDQRACVFVVALQLGPRVAEGDEDEAPDYGVLGRRVVHVDARHQPAVRLDFDLHVQLGAAPADTREGLVGPGQALRHQVQEGDPLVVAQGHRPVLPDLDAVDGQQDVVHLEPPERGPQRPDGGDAHAAREVAVQAELFPQRLRLERLDPADPEGRHALVLPRSVHAGEELLNHSRRDDVPDVRGVLEVAAGDAHHEAVGAEHRASRVARIDRGVDLEAQEPIAIHVDARHHAPRDRNVLAAHGEADARHVVVQAREVVRELQALLAAPEVALLHGEHGQVARQARGHHPRAVLDRGPACGSNQHRHGAAHDVSICHDPLPANQESGAG
mmetsp:Transcript_24492/g.64622  ORF Transcript_24492/g.64622 Transcript_24492/m.64622 type:complete len:331 (+) Transcript_24492:467-1459(+)